MNPNKSHGEHLIIIIIYIGLSNPEIIIENVELAIINIHYNTVWNLIKTFVITDRIGDCLIPRHNPFTIKPYNDNYNIPNIDL